MRAWQGRKVYKSVTKVSGHQKRNAAVLLNGQGFSRGEPHGFHSTKKEIHVANFTYPTATDTPDAADAPKASRNSRNRRWPWPLLP